MPPRITGRADKRPLAFLQENCHGPLRLDAAEPVRCGTEEYSRFFALSLDLLCIADLEGTIRDLSASVLPLLGYREEELIGTPYLRLIHADDQPRVLAQLEALKQGEDTLSIEFRARCKDGSHRWMECTCPAPKGEGGFLYAVCRDVTEKKGLQEQVCATEQRLSRSSTTLPP